MTTIIIETPGEPRGKGRPRFSRATGRAYTDAKTVSYESALAYAASEVMAARPPLEGPLRVSIFAYMGVAKSWSNKKRDAALAGIVRPTKKPDMDNITKMVDALNKIVWIDDSQIVSQVFEKFYSNRPRLRIEVEPVGI